MNEYKKYIEKDKALERRFQQVGTVDPPPPLSLSLTMYAFAVRCTLAVCYL